MSRFKTYRTGGDGSRTIWPFLISLAGHLILFGVILFNPQWIRRSESYIPSVIDVQMVDLSDDGSSTPTRAPVKDSEKAPIEAEPEPREPAPEAAPAPSAAKPEVSIAESKPEPRFKKKTALKYETFKSKEVLKSALENIEKRVERTPPKPLEDTIKRLKEKVAQTEKGTEGSSMPETDAGAQSKTGGFLPGSRQENELINIYRGEIAYRINANWAFSEQLADRSQRLMASIAFKVMPDGSIEDIFFVDRSGNQYLDDSAMKAIMKSSPVMPHPKELNRSYVEMGLNFTPAGVH